MPEETVDNFKEVVIGGVRYTVTPEMAAAMEKETTERQQQIDLKDQEILTQQEALYSIQQPPKPDDTIQKQGYQSIGERLFVEPDLAIRDLKKEIKDEIIQMYQEDKAKEVQVQNDQQLLVEFYANFFKKHSHLKEDEALVVNILSANYQKKWAKLTQDELMDELEKEVTQTILRHTKQEQEVDIVLEGVTNVTQRTQEKPTEKPTTLTSIMKARTEARRKAANG